MRNEFDYLMHASSCFLVSIMMIIIIVVLYATHSTLVISPGDTVIRYAQAQTDVNNTALNQSSSNHHNFELWATNSEISIAWSSGIHGKICPNPEVDAPTKFKIDPYSGASIRDPDPSVTISIYLTMPNGTTSYLDEGRTFRSDRDFCSEGFISNAFYPAAVDGVGKYTFYGIARWISNGSIQEIRSNEVTVIVRPALYQSDVSQEQVLTPDISVKKLLDWSSDGKSILVSRVTIADPQSGETKTSLALISPEDGKTIKAIELPINFKSIFDAKFPPSRDDLMFVWGEQDNTNRTRGLYVFDLSDNSVSTIEEDSRKNHINSAAWLPEGNATKIVYGQQVYSEASERTYQGFTMWVADSDGNKVEKLYEKLYDDDGSENGKDKEHFIINDASKNGKRVLVTRLISYGPFSLSNLTSFDIERKQFERISGGDMSNVQFSPSNDLIIYDDPAGHRTPGGPLVIMAADGSWFENFKIGERKPYDDPVSFVISPDGQFVVAKVVEWGSGNGRFVKSTLAHPVPEFGTVAAFIMPLSIVAAVLAANRLRLKKW